MSEIEINEVMMELGRKFAKKAEEAESAKGAKLAFNLAERAFSLALRAKKQYQAPIMLDSTLIFLSMIEEVVRRSELWVSYNEFCLENNTEPISKGELFSKLGTYGFSVGKTDGAFKVKPPRRMHQALISANKAASQQNQQSDTLPE